MYIPPLLVSGCGLIISVVLFLSVLSLEVHHCEGVCGVEVHHCEGVCGENLKMLSWTIQTQVCKLRKGTQQSVTLTTRAEHLVSRAHKKELTLSNRMQLLF